MTHRRILFLESTCTILGCTSEEFWSIYESDKLATDVLSDNVLAPTTNDYASLTGDGALTTFYLA
jgi:hypothetical protein